jgi:tRNA1(Val) A37 N6-methylase TrmN6
MSAETSHQITQDRFLGGGVTLLQPASGYRAGLDAVLLAASLSAKPGERLAEAGCGAGAALMCAAYRLSGVHVAGFERDEAMSDLARRSAALNQLEERVTVTAHDISGRPLDLENQFDQSFCNPPFFEPGTIRQPAEGRRAAYVLDQPLKVWVQFLVHITRAGGRITLIHRAGVLADLLEVMSARMGEIEVLPIRAAPGQGAHRILVRGRNGLKRGPVTLYEGVTLHETPGGELTARARAALNGAALDWV